MPGRDHQAAAECVCEATSLLPREQVAARGRLCDWADTKALQCLPFDAWSTDAGTAVKLDFCYATSGPPRLGVRVLTDLRTLDGVAAARIALHVLDLLEGVANAPLPSTGFCRNKTFAQTRQQVCNTSSVLFWLVLDLVFLPTRLVAKLASRRPLDPNSPEGWLWFFRRRAEHKPAEIRLFAPEDNQFKLFLEKVDDWRRSVKLRNGFFFLLNYSPAVTVGLVRSSEELLAGRTKRLNHAFGPPKQPQVGAGLHGVYLLLHRRMMWNNYGRHTHRFTAVPTAFCWDWLSFPATLSCAFCISINGRFLCGIRGVDKFVQKGLDALGEDVGLATELRQITHHPDQRWTGVSAAAPAVAGAEDAARGQEMALGMESSDDEGCTASAAREDARTETAARAEAWRFGGA